MSIANTINIGILGCANIAVRAIMPELHRHTGFHLVAIASRSREKALPLAALYGCQVTTYEQLVSHPDIAAIYIPLPNALHLEWVARCLAAGKHVLCEKSLGCTLAEVEAMTALARDKRLLVMENFQFRFHSQHAYVKSVVASGFLGEIRCFRSSFGFPPFSDGIANIRYQQDLGGGALLDAGAYTVK
ncbi:MAG: Gfo/Idh/MocA family oxidoreductase, partial [bacterium]